MRQRDSPCLTCREDGDAAFSRRRLALARPLPGPSKVRSYPTRSLCSKKDVRKPESEWAASREGGLGRPKGTCRHFARTANWDNIIVSSRFQCTRPRPWGEGRENNAHILSSARNLRALCCSRAWAKGLVRPRSPRGIIWCARARQEGSATAISVGNTPRSYGLGCIPNPGDGKSGMRRCSSSCPGATRPGFGISKEWGAAHRKRAGQHGVRPGECEGSQAGARHRMGLRRPGCAARRGAALPG